MIKLESTETYGWEAAIRGMRNPMNSWDKSDSMFLGSPRFDTKNADAFAEELSEHGFYIGPNDHKLCMKLVEGGPEHAKFRRMITVSVDITAPRYWWTEYDTYKIGTVANSCSTMHTIHKQPFTIDDFSHERLIDDDYYKSTIMMDIIVGCLNDLREAYIKTGDKKYWYQIIQLLPQSYNQKRTVMLNYEVLSNIYNQRKNHKLDEWHKFCDWIKTLPYFEFITGEEN